MLLLVWRESFRQVCHLCLFHVHAQHLQLGAMGTQERLDHWVFQMRHMVLVCRAERCSALHKRTRQKYQDARKSPLLVLLWKRFPSLPVCIQRARGGTKKVEHSHKHGRPAFLQNGVVASFPTRSTLTTRTSRGEVQVSQCATDRNCSGCNHSQPEQFRL